MRNTKDKLFRDKTLRHLHDDLNICGVVRNYFLALCMRYYRRYGKGISYKKMSAHLTKLKKLEKYKHWNIPYSWALQNVLKRLSQSFREMKTLGRSHPQFKSCQKHKGMTFRGEQVKFEYLLPKQKNEFGLARFLLWITTKTLPSALLLKADARQTAETIRRIKSD